MSLLNNLFYAGYWQQILKAEKRKMFDPANFTCPIARGFCGLDFKKSPLSCLFIARRTKHFSYLIAANISQKRVTVHRPIRIAINIPWWHNCQRNVTCGLIQCEVNCESNQRSLKGHGIRQCKRICPRKLCVCFCPNRSWEKLDFRLCSSPQLFKLFKWRE